MTEPQSQTHVSFVLDSSGSMAKIEEDTKGGFNSFLHDQHEEEGEATVSLYEFNTDITPVYTAQAIENAEDLTSENYQPGGRTALHDAITYAVDDTTDHLDALSAADEPDNIIIVVLTDGKENASETPTETVKEQVEEKQEEGWEFLFIGANQDAALEAEKRGMSSGKSYQMDHSEEGVRDAIDATSESVSKARREGETGGYDE